MPAWRVKNLGDAMLATEALEHIQVLFLAAYKKAGSPDDMAIYVRHEAEGRLHCDVKVYFTPATREVAEVIRARYCPIPSPEGLGLLAGSKTALFDK
ncbi:hypothetical protein [Neptunomonas japonica]|uniref:Uncharacterized protein n=1 Tax=Neptunomonas japonica JAMM 1380 TaxID=1441457 RepID=A0A7R6SWU6_9GAMM|nr:hypothetical protein [Neptunomonas japonica]BBB30835.1 conserved hypothetical protein [Neptunomonas japonica JAMM 1380]